MTTHVPTTSTATTDTMAAPRRLTAAVRRDWDRFAAPVTDPEVFDPVMVRDLPEPARRWLTHAIAPGTPLWRSVRLRMHGHIRLGSWRPFTATQVLAVPEGFVWAATARFAGLPVIGYDRFTAGTGQMRWRLLGVVPVMSVSGADTTRSAAGRLASEGALLPTVFRSAVWTPTTDPDTVTATWVVGGSPHAVALRVRPDGALDRILLQRWGNPDGGAFAWHPFGVDVAGETTFGGVTMVTSVRAGWHWGSDRQDDGEFFRAEITDALLG